MANPDKARRLVGYQEAARFLGVKVSTLYAQVSRRRVPHIRINQRSVRFDLDALEIWLATKEVRPVDDEGGQ